MNKYIIILIIAAVLMGTGYGFSKIKKPSENVVASTGNEVHITIRAVRDEWRWDMENVKVKAGDTVILTLINEDDYDHGIGLEGYGISERMPANRTIVIEFVAKRKGLFVFFCSVPCGKGTVANSSSPYDGQERDHFDMLGTLEVI
jgi:heme/copper-type cytochrome/quinol oxidase subunit 2